MKNRAACILEFLMEEELFSDLIFIEEFIVKEDFCKAFREIDDAR
jgi:hypothetical protein